MTEESLPPITTEPPSVVSAETRVINHFKKAEVHKENSLYPDPTPKCYIGNGNNSEL
jgi:hypothetical protein